MDELELTRRLEGADPARTRVAAPLTARALADLDAITSGDYVPRLRRMARRRSRARRVALLSIATALLLTAVVVVRTVNPASVHTDAAYASTPPLLQPTGPAVPFAKAIDTSLRRLAATDDLPSTALRQSHYEAWFANITFGGSDDVATSAAVSPEEDTFTWQPDLSGRIRSVAGTSWNAGSNGYEGGETVAAPGTVLRDETYKPGEVGVAFPQQPSTDVAGLSQQLVAAGWSDESNPALLVSSVNELLDEWTLTAAQQSAVLEVVAKTPGFSSLGSVTDRLGRVGLAFRAPDPSNATSEQILVLSATTGAVLSIESIYLGGNPQFAKVLSAPAVLGYTAWK